MMDTKVLERPNYEPLQHFAGRYKLWLGVILALTITSSVVEGLSVIAFFPVFNSLLGESDAGTSGILGSIIRVTESLPISSPIVAASVLLVGVFALKTAFTLTREYATAYVASKMMYSVRRQVMERYAGAHYQFMLDNQQGSLLYNIFDAPSSVANIIITGAQFGTGLLKIVSIVGLLMLIFPIAAMALIGLGVLYYISIHFLSRKISYPIGAERAIVSANQLTIANEFLTGFRQIVAFNATGWWASKFDIQNRRFTTLLRKEMAWNAVPKPFMELFAVTLLLLFVFIIWASGPDSVAVRLPTLGVFAVAMAQLFPPLNAIGAARMRIMAILPNLALAHNAINGPVPMRPEGSQHLDRLKKSIDFENVSFGYSSREPLFQNLNLSIEQGKVTAIVGTSGAGKTTIINLILGLFEPTGGRITVDGIPIQDLKRDSWLGKIGFVSQESFVYHSTVTDNILIGRTDHSEESIISAARIANAHEFISDLPNGYQTIVGERGMKFSGGQQQRLAITRAMLDSPEFMLFDEATSSLDTISERLVQQAIDKVSKDRTVVIIAHRLSTISHADKIIVLDGGQVVETGCHEELLNQDGFYARLAGAVN